MRYKNSRDEGRPGGDTMPGSTELSPDGSKAGGLEVTHQLVKRAESKLVKLHANRSQLRRRISALHHLLKTLETVFSPFGCPDPALYHAAEKAGFNHDESSGGTSDTAVSLGTRSQETETGAHAVTGVSKLRRACRIALMESDRDQSCEEILQRIRRRESICIEGFHDPKIAIVQELRKMLVDGEAMQKESSQLWQLNRDSGRGASERKSERE